MIKLNVTQERMKMLTVDQLCALEDMAFGEKVRLRDMRNLFAHFATGEDGNYLEPQAARAAIGGLTVTELEATAKGFSSALQDAAIPPVNGSN